jgi:hypothetical protein
LTKQSDNPPAGGKERDFEDLERWEAAQLKPPTIFDVLETGDINLFGAFVLRAFRAAAAEAVEETRRVQRVRSAVLKAFHGHAKAAESFLRTPDESLAGKTPLELAVASDAGAATVVELSRGRIPPGKISYS